jgi:hypothetical protein
VPRLAAGPPRRGPLAAWPLVVRTWRASLDRKRIDRRSNRTRNPQRLRDEKKFDGVDALKAQIHADRVRTKDLFDRMGL